LPNQWVRVDLGQVVSISGVATQGSQYGKVTAYKIRYSYDGRTWYGYPNNASLQVSTIFYFFKESVMQYGRAVDMLRGRTTGAVDLQ
jgi:hypothetical protein